MIQGYYAAVAGMVTAVRRMEVLIHNLSNMETPGYKQERTSSMTFSAEQVGQVAQTATGPLVLSMAAGAPELDLSQGPVHPTGRALDVALQGTAFLAAEGSEGVVYTRDGSLSRDAAGYLTTSAGKRVLGESGAIQVPNGPMTIGTDGALWVDNERVGHLKLVDFAEEQTFERLGGNELAPRGDVTAREAVGTTVLQGFIEGSNVDLTTTMTTMMELQRAYEANQRMIRSQDELARLATDIAEPTS